MPAFVNLFVGFRSHTYLGTGVPVYMEKVIYNKELMRENGVYFAVGSLTDDYYRGSFFTNFCTMTSGLFGAGKPADYSRQTVEGDRGAV